MQRSLIAMSISWRVQSEEISDAESVIGHDARFCEMCERVCKCVYAWVYVSQWLKGLQCHLGPEDISATPMKWEGRW